MQIKSHYSCGGTYLELPKEKGWLILLAREGGVYRNTWWRSNRSPRRWGDWLPRRVGGRWRSDNRLDQEGLLITVTVEKDNMGGYHVCIRSWQLYSLYTGYHGVLLEVCLCVMVIVCRLVIIAYCGVYVCVSYKYIFIL